ncbi:MAG: hypothetical protein FK730_01835 [Asgard group archaeon]|nr:hypothetical protein [Asgard group archaeon]
MIILQSNHDSEGDLIDTKIKSFSELEELLLRNAFFRFGLQYNDRKLLRNGIVLLVLSTIIGSSLGILLFYVLKWLGITDDYAVLGIGAGLGAGFGIVLGTFLLIGLQTRIVEEYSAGYGIGISTNIFIGTIIGVMFGAGVGALFGLVLEAINYGIETNFVYPVYGMLIWIVLGLNIGVFVGLITSFGFIDIILGGAITGIFIGTIGLLIYYGPDIIILIGTATGLISGTLIGILTKLSVRANLGKAEDVRCGCGQRIFEFDQKSDRRRRRRAYFCGPNYLSFDNINCGGCGTRGGLGGGSCNCFGTNCGSTCCGSNCGISNWLGMNCGTGNCFGVGFIFLILLIPIIILISVVSWFSAKASIAFGKKVRKGAFPALISSTLIGLILGCNIAIVISFRSFDFYSIIGISAGFGIVFSLIVLLAFWISIIDSQIEISYGMITWKDRYTSGSLFLHNIVEYSFIKQGKLVEGISRQIDDFLYIELIDGQSYKILLSCWKTPEGTTSFEYLQTILQYYIKHATKEFETTENLYSKEILTLK